MISPYVCGSGKHNRKQFVLSLAIPASVYRDAYVLFTQNGCETEYHVTTQPPILHSAHITGRIHNRNT